VEYSLTDLFHGVKNKAQVWVFEGLKEIKRRVPFAILGIDSDNVLTSKSTLPGEETLPWHVLCDEAFSHSPSLGTDVDFHL